MHFVSTVLIPSLVIVMMTVVGLELTVGDFRRIAAFPRLLAVSLAAQMIALPLIAALVIRLLHADASLAGGLILVAASPIAVISNYYTMLAKGNVALAVTLTMLSSLLALIATPLSAAFAFELLLDTTSTIRMPVVESMRQLLIALALPIAVGMLTRRLMPRWVERHRRVFVAASMTALAALVLYVLFDQAAIIAHDLRHWVAAALLFTLGALASGYGLAAVLRCRPSDRTAVAVGFGARNLAIAIMLGATVLHRLDFVAFGAVFFLSQLVLVAPLLAWSRGKAAGYGAFRLPWRPTSGG